MVKMRQSNRLDSLNNRLLAAAERNITLNKHRIDTLSGRLAPAATLRITKARHALELLEQRAATVDPSLMLKRGYSITLINGRTVRDAGEVKAGDIMETRVERGVLKSKVIK